MWQLQNRGCIGLSRFCLLVTNRRVECINLGRQIIRTASPHHLWPSLQRSDDARPVEVLFILSPCHPPALNVADVAMLLRFTRVTMLPELAALSLVPGWRLPYLVLAGCLLIVPIFQMCYLFAIFASPEYLLFGGFVQ